MAIIHAILVPTQLRRTSNSCFCCGRFSNPASPGYLFGFPDKSRHACGSCARLITGCIKFSDSVKHFAIVNLSLLPSDVEFSIRLLFSGDE